MLAIDSLSSQIFINSMLKMDHLQLSYRRVTASRNASLPSTKTTTMAIVTAAATNAVQILWDNHGGRNKLRPLMQLINSNIIMVLDE